MEWLFHYEYELLGLPRPDLVFYLDLPPEVSEGLLRRREADTHTQADIHEKDCAYLARSRAAGLQAAAQCGWRVIRCDRAGAVRPAEEIHEEICGAVKALL